jgi:ABC-type phosphate transport system substrate-binding protein
MARWAFRGFIFFLLLTGTARAQCIPGGLVVVVNKSNAVESLSLSQLRKLILGDVRTWQDRKQASFVARDPSTKDFQCVLSSIVRQSVAEYHRYVINAEFRGDEPMNIKVVDSDTNAARAVSSLPGGFAVIEANSVSAVTTSVKVIRIEGKELGQPGYPL